MGVFVRAVVTGFGFSLGAALYKKVSKRLGIEDAAPAAPASPGEVATHAGPPPARPPIATA